MKPPLPSIIGLIAGEGQFPFMVLAEAKQKRIEVVTVAIEGEADPKLEEHSDGFHWIDLGNVSKCVRAFRDAGVSQAIMAGRVRHVRAFQILKPDWLMLKVLARLPSRTTEAMLTTLADVLADEGIELLDSTLLLTSHLAGKGAMSRRRPSKQELADVRFGVSKARALASADIGQTVIVKGQSIVSAEAMEGTDAAIRRARDVVEGPFVVVKVARPKQDPRFDVPVVGPTTIASMEAAGARALGIESGRVLLLDREELLRAADESDIAVYGFGDD